MIAIVTRLVTDKGKQQVRVFPGVTLENLGGHPMFACWADQVHAFPLRAILNKDKTPVIRKVYLNEKNS